MLPVVSAQMQYS